MRKALAVILVASVLPNMACGDPVAPPAPTPVAATITDAFTGTLVVGGANSHLFTVQQVGGVSVTLTSTQPSAALGVGVGTPSGLTCIVAPSTTTLLPGIGGQLVGTATVTGNLCVSVFDPGNLVEPVTYTITVFHS